MSAYVCVSEQQCYSCAGLLQGVTNSPFLSVAGADTPPAAAPPQSHHWKKGSLRNVSNMHFNNIPPLSCVDIYPLSTSFPPFFINLSVLENDVSPCDGSPAALTSWRQRLFDILLFHAKSEISGRARFLWQSCRGERWRGANRVGKQTSWRGKISKKWTTAGRLDARRTRWRIKLSEEGKSLRRE